MCFISKVEQKNVKESLIDEFWINGMHEELSKFERNEVWKLVPRLNFGNLIEENGLSRISMIRMGLFPKINIILWPMDTNRSKGLTLMKTLLHTFDLEL